MAADLFEQHFKNPVTGTAIVPGRVNLIGEHTDYNGGMVLPAVIDRTIDVAIGPSNTEQDLIYSDGYGHARALHAGAPLDTTSWWAYAQGCLNWGRDQGYDLPPMAMAFQSSVPEGAGLSSSAAMTVGVFKALRDGGYLSLDDVAIALAAQAVENNYIGVPCGIMDQMAVSVGQAGMALALDTETLAIEHVGLNRTHDFSVIHSGITRKLTDGRYKDRRVECEAAASALGVAKLCTLSETSLGQLSTLPGNLARRARHVITEHARVLRAINALKTGDIQKFGELMNESHVSYRDDFEASTPEIDFLVEAGVKMGAVGARLTGGGFGGCIVACIEKAKRETWQADLVNRFPKINIIC